jgi:hypothetical protein
MSILKYIFLKKLNIDLSKLFIIFDIDGVLLRKKETNSIEFSPISNEFFTLIDNYNIKYSIATHGANHITLKKDFSPINSYIRKLDTNYIKHINMPQYNLSQYKLTMLNDLISQANNDFDIKYVLFIDDDINNINSFNQLQDKYNNLKFININIKLTLSDVINNESYPLLNNSILKTRNIHDEILYLLSS